MAVTQDLFDDGIRVAWTSVCVVVLALAILNTFSVVQIETRIEALETQAGTTSKPSPTSRLSKNWDIAIAVVVLSGLLAASTLQPVQQYASAHRNLTLAVVTAVILLCGGLVVLNRFVLKDD